MAFLLANEVVQTFNFNCGLAMHKCLHALIMSSTTIVFHKLKAHIPPETVFALGGQHKQN